MLLSIFLSDYRMDVGWLELVKAGEAMRGKDFTHVQ
jgi:hypothetical protein